MASRQARIGQIVEIRQIFGGRDEWLPMIVTHVDGDVIGGVAFSAYSSACRWNSRGSQPFTEVKQGTGNREWRFQRSTARSKAKDDLALVDS